MKFSIKINLNYWTKILFHKMLNLCNLTCSLLSFLQIVINSWNKILWAFYGNYVGNAGMGRHYTIILQLMYLGQYYLLGHKSIPIFIHQLEQFLYRGLLPHDLCEGQSPIKISVHGREKLINFLPENRHSGNFVSVSLQCNLLRYLIELPNVQME